MQQIKRVCVEEKLHIKKKKPQAQQKGWDCVHTCVNERGGVMDIAFYERAR